MARIPHAVYLVVTLYESDGYPNVESVWTTKLAANRAARRLAEANHMLQFADTDNDGLTTYYDPGDLNLITIQQRRVNPDDSS